MSDISLEFVAMKMAEAHANGAAAERASIVAMISRFEAERLEGKNLEEADGDSLEAEVFWNQAIAARMIRKCIERSEHAQPEPARDYSCLQGKPCVDPSSCDHPICHAQPDARAEIARLQTAVGELESGYQNSMELSLTYHGRLERANNEIVRIRAAERASIVALARSIVNRRVIAGDPCTALQVFIAAVERSEHAQPEPAMENPDDL